MTKRTIQITGHHPDVETCKAISSKFDGSEFVWIDCKAEGYWPHYLVFGIEGDVILVKRKAVGVHPIICNAPITDDLGKWLVENLEAIDPAVLDMRLTRFGMMILKAFLTDNPSQSLAESVRAILER